jgi:hypothetical protein
MLGPNGSEHQHVALLRRCFQGAATKAPGAALQIPQRANRRREHRLPVGQHGKPTQILDREVMRAALRLREGQWREVLRGKHIAQARLVLQHLIDLPIKILNQPVPTFIKKGDRRGTENIAKWTATTRPGGLLVGLVHNMASPAGFEPAFWP